MFMKVDDCIDDSDVGSDKLAMLPASLVHKMRIVRRFDFHHTKAIAV